MTLESHARRTTKRLRAAPRPRPDQESVQVAIEALEAQLSQQLEALRAIETKASLVVPVFGVVGALLAGKTVTANLSLVAAASGGIAIASAIAAVVYALRCFQPDSYSVGPDPVLLARATGEPAEALRQAVADALAIAASSVRIVVIRKAAYLNRSLLAGGSSLANLAAFAILGGFR